MVSVKTMMSCDFIAFWILISPSLSPIPLMFQVTMRAGCAFVGSVTGIKIPGGSITFGVSWSISYLLSGMHCWVIGIDTNIEVIVVSLMSQNCPWLQHGYMCTFWGHVTRLFLLGNAWSNHCHVTVRFVTLNFNCTLNQNRQQNIHYHSWETDQN